MLIIQNYFLSFFGKIKQRKPINF